ncbi:AsmA family protein [Spongiibacter nanhainus]|uniref:AsmA family protein n=1 Tax=Spongiibacter nanhainus TaxID=2794344 RepID=A0A7T4QYZ4_9GAMM|nr:AsmA family protein [Spongiibacter nanhainus]QQD17383.1 AsmA family protein [Spongiibacter nanhainus]
MSRAVYITLKWVALATVGILALAATAIAALLFWIDPGLFRDDLEDLARQQGIALHLRGELDWRIYPQIQIITTDTALGAIDAPPLAELDSLAVSVALRPLLRSELQVIGITVAGLRARFEVDENGDNNWQTLIDRTNPPGETPTQTSATPPNQDSHSTPISIDKLRVVDSQINYINRLTAQTASVSNINVVIENLGQAGAPSTVALKAKLTASDPAQVVSSEFAIESTLNANTQFSALELQDANVDIALHYRAGEKEIDSRLQLPLLSLSVNLEEPLSIKTLAVKDGNISYTDNQGNRVQARELLVTGKYQAGIADNWKLAGAIDATLATGGDGQARTINTTVEAGAVVMPGDNAKTFALDKVHLQLFPELNPLRISGDAKLQFDPLDVQGQVSVAKFNPQTLAAALTLPLPERADPQSLTNTSVRSRFSVTETLLNVTEIALTLDDTTAKGKLSLPLGDAGGRPIRVTLNLDQIDLDRYLPPPDSTEPGNKEEASSPTQREEWDFSALSDLRLEADVQAGRFTLRRLPFTDTRLSLAARDGKVTLSSLKGKLYDSPITLAGELDTGAMPYRVSTEGQASHLPLGRVLKDLQLEERFSGNSDIAFQLSTRGNHASALQQALNGHLSVTGRELSLSGMNIERAFCRLVTAVQKQAFNPAEWADVTHFADTTTRIHFKKGVARIEQLKAGVSQLAVSAKGKVDLGQSLFDVVFNTRLASQDKQHSPCTIDNPKLLDRDIPIRCQASFDGLDLSTCLPDMRVAEDIAKEKLKDKIDDKAKSFLEEKLGEEKSKAAEQLFKQLIKPSTKSSPPSEQNNSPPSPTENDTAGQ